jgi:hypothetical protein
MRTPPKSAVRCCRIDLRAGGIGQRLHLQVRQRACAGGPFFAHGSLLQLCRGNSMSGRLNVPRPMTFNGSNINYRPTLQEIRHRFEAWAMPIRCPCLMEQTLKNCRDVLPRTNVMKQAANFHSFRVPYYLPALASTPASRTSIPFRPLEACRNETRLKEARHGYLSLFGMRPSRQE